MTNRHAANSRPRLGKPAGLELAFEGIPKLVSAPTSSIATHVRMTVHNVRPSRAAVCGISQQQNSQQVTPKFFGMPRWIDFLEGPGGTDFSGMNQHCTTHVAGHLSECHLTERHSYQIPTLGRFPQHPFARATTISNDFVRASPSHSADSIVAILAHFHVPRSRGPDD